MLRRSLLLSAVVVSVVGCASGPPPLPQFVESASQALPPPPADAAQIVFLEPINSIQGAVPVGIFKVDGDQNTLLAITGAKSKVAVNLAPGKHLLMGNQTGVPAHFLEANVEAGKRYYVLLRFIYARGFQLRPLRPSGPSDFTVQNRSFPEWVSQTRFVEMTPHGVERFTTMAAGVRSSQAEGWANWLAKTPAERAELTLNAQDAIAP